MRNRRKIIWNAFQRNFSNQIIVLLQFIKVNQKKSSFTYISSKHKSVKVEQNDKCITETVSYYNKTKFGVDMTDQMARKYSIKFKSRRWPVQRSSIFQYPWFSWHEYLDFIQGNDRRKYIEIRYFTLVSSKTCWLSRSLWRTKRKNKYGSNID